MVEKQQKASSNSEKNPELPESSNESVVTQERQCWICFETEAEEEGLTASLKPKWIRPCLCCGDTKWAHEKCLFEWIDEKQAGNNLITVKCPQCQIPYELMYPSSGWYIQSIELLNRCCTRCIPYIGISAVLYCGYVSAVSYGICAVYQVLGAHEGRRILLRQWTWRHWVGLPMIPFGLIISCFDSFDSLLLMLPMTILDGDIVEMTFPPQAALTIILLPWAKIFYQSLLQAFLGPKSSSTTRTDEYIPHNSTEPIGEHRISLENDIMISTRIAHRELNMTRIERRTVSCSIQTIVGALLLPYMASFVGRTLFRTCIKDPFHRTVIGGCVCFLMRDISAIMSTIIYIRIESYYMYFYIVITI
jgi:hypothetical protein